MMNGWHKICPESALLEGQRHIIDIDDKHIMVVRHQGALHAVESLCSHALFELDDGDINDCSLSCPLHGAHFCLKTGEALSGPAVEPIKVYELSIHNETIYIKDN